MWSGSMVYDNRIDQRSMVLCLITLGGVVKKMVGTVLTNGEAMG